MTAAQIALKRENSTRKFFSVIAKSGILFDYISVVWLLLISGGIQSPLVPLAFLVIMYSTIYWRTKGALLSSATFTGGFAVMLAMEAYNCIRNGLHFYPAPFFHLDCRYAWFHDCHQGTEAYEAGGDFPGTA
ncbi:hypothetical protein [Mesobacillus zeae]|uniref:Uncharacterized protein n=1 Tax=Mesobacillus zeae TaxID=1917180 RepID=A0A398BHD8_9BACI|nr:hypothetical protein [Mesobacillus zeae]RID88058.1 hypothetical protein D1970_04280 [Mesobacillus zeae]